MLPLLARDYAGKHPVIEPDTAAARSAGAWRAWIMPGSAGCADDTTTREALGVLGAWAAAALTSGALPPDTRDVQSESAAAR